jgi:hypothetical protein
LYWLAHDDNYSSHMIFLDSKSSITTIGKLIFNFIFAYSIDSFNNQISSVVNTHCVHQDSDQSPGRFMSTYHL